MISQFESCNTVYNLDCVSILIGLDKTSSLLSENLTYNQVQSKFNNLTYS